MSVTNVTIPTAQSFILVDTRTGPNKVLFLPTASTIQGRYLTIKDYYGNATRSTLTISTTGLDYIDNIATKYNLASSFGSVMLLSDGLRSWNMMGLYEGADTPSTMVASLPTSFTSFRWTITAGSSDSLVQFSEFQVGYNNTQVVFSSPTTATTGSTISWNTGSSEGPAQAVDNNINTKGLGIGTSGLVLIVTVATPITVNMYRWATANDATPGRNPTQWTVDGSTDNVNFIRLHTQNTTYAGPSSTFTFIPWISFTYT